VNPRQQQRKAFQTAEGFTCTGTTSAVVYDPTGVADVIPMERPQRTCPHTDLRSD
jgi:hypothetical protein